MDITIWDMDFYCRTTVLPSPVAMKISMYHKQIGDSINFVETKYNIDMAFDKMYILKKKKKTTMPAGRFLEDSRVKLVGKYFKYYDNY